MKDLENVPLTLLRKSATNEGTGEYPSAAKSGSEASQGSGEYTFSFAL